MAVTALEALSVGLYTETTPSRSVEPLEALRSDAAVGLGRWSRNGRPAPERPRAQVPARSRDGLRLRHGARLKDVSSVGGP